MRSVCLRVTIVVILGVVCTHDARAAPSPIARAHAAERYREAQAAFALREYASAAAAFEEAAAVVPHPAALLSAADAWERAGDPARAAEDCERARSLSELGAASASDGVDYAADASACVTRVRSRVALLQIRGEGVLAARIDDGPEQALPVRRWVRSGHHVIVVRDLVLTSAEPRRLELDVARGEERSLEVPGAPSPPSPPRPIPSSAPIAIPTPAPAPTSLPAPPPTAIPNAPPTRPGRRLPTGSWVAFGVAIPANVVWGVFASLTLSAQGDFNASPTQATASTFYRDRAFADAAFGTAAVAACVALVWWLASPARAPMRANLLAPTVVY